MGRFNVVNVFVHASGRPPTQDQSKKLDQRPIEPIRIILYIVNGLVMAYEILIRMLILLCVFSAEKNDQSRGQ